jgi:hypothetical protein
MPAVDEGPRWPGKPGLVQTTEVRDMMSYELFKTLVKDQIKDYLPQSFAFYEVNIHTVYKINEKLDCMTLVPPDGSGMCICPTVYLDERYEEFRHCRDLDQVLTEIAWVYINYSGTIPGDYDFDLKNRLDMIVMDIVNTEKNEEMLENVPNRSMLDFSVMYRFVMQMGPGGIDTILITNSLARDLDLSEEELFTMAAANTKKVLPMKIITMREVISETVMTAEQRNEYMKRSAEPFIVTNELLMHGSSYLALPDVLKEISEKIQDSYYVIPSSINEFFVSPARFTDPAQIRDRLRYDNASNTAKKDILSDNVYYFDKTAGDLRIA